MASEKLERYLMTNVDLTSRKGFIIGWIIIDLVLIVGLYTYIPSAWEIEAYKLLSKQWAQPPIIGLYKASLKDDCKETLKAKFYGTKAYCHLYG